MDDTVGEHKVVEKRTALEINPPPTSNYFYNYNMICKKAHFAILCCVKSGTNTLKVFISTKRKGKLNFEFNKG
jgi:hypothetical protein